MSTPIRKFNVLLAIMSLALLAILTSACAFVPYHLGDFSQEIAVTIDEEMFSQSRPTFQIHNHNIWEELDVDVDRLELHDGYIRFLGTKVMPDGSLADCSIDVSMGAEDGSLTAKIIAVDIPGIAVSDSPVVEINQDMEVLLHLNDFDPTSEVKFQEVKVTEDELQITVEVTVRF
jgi:hypothetical protein